MSTYTKNPDDAGHPNGDKRDPKKGGDDKPVVPPEPFTPFPFPLPDRRSGKDGKYRGKGDDDPIYAPYIVLNHTDPANPGGVFYLSPDIWVESTLGINLPVEGEANNIFARVHNQGLLDAMNVNVRFYWADPSAAITDQSINPIGGDAAAATAMGVYIPAALAPGQDSAVLVQCPVPWFPASITHECLIVKAWSPGFDPNVQPWEPVLDPINDRHSAQHNVTVKMLPPGANFMLSIGVANISGFAQSLLVQVRALSTQEVAAQAKMLQLKLPVNLSASRRTLPIEGGLASARRFMRHDPATFAGLMVAGDDKDPAGAGIQGKVVMQIEDKLAAWEQRQLDLKGAMLTSAKPGEAFGFDISAYLGGIKTGGYVALFIAKE
ncbi:MAG: hypothetical protein COA47_04885 [Robiginitomaculum sp.]|nr:MAG: hypothetical protein COA47_04885 [Robiginitomaculum sp.]